MKKRKGLTIEIIFQAPYINTTYHLSQYGNNYIEDSNFTYSWYYNTTDENKCIYGEEVAPVNDQTITEIFLGKDLSGLKYYQTFWDLGKSQNNEDKSYAFFPILLNGNGDIVSFIMEVGDRITVMLPQANDKVSILRNIFHNYLYKAFSKLFPEKENHAWLDCATYKLPEVLQLEEQKKDLEQEYHTKISECDSKIASAMENHRFLYDLITETGTDLVKAIMTYMRWLGFEKLSNGDTIRGNKGEELLEEDIEAKEANHDLLLIEVKGIYGTSKDSECSQIDKNVQRRMRELDSTHVHGLYIVNNERGVEPLRRTIPPFNDIQIKDAENMSRGLMYTWQLFNLYFEISNGVISKEHARECFYKVGLISFRDELQYIGKAYKLYQNNTVLCLHIDGVEIYKGSQFAIEDKNGRLSIYKIMDIQKQHTSVERAVDGDFGFLLNHHVIYSKGNVYCFPDQK